MATTITGPGLSGAGSEIAAVSVGVYATTNGFDAGMSHVRQTTQQTAVAVEQQMAVAGTAIQSNIVGGAVEGAKGFRKAIKNLEKTAMTGFIGVAFVTGAFKLGTEIGEALVSGFDKKGKVLKDNLERLGDQAASAIKDKLNEAAKNTKASAADIEAARQKIDALGKKIEEYRNALRQVQAEVERARKLNEQFPSADAQLALNDALREEASIREKLAEAEKRQGQERDKFNNKLRESNRIETDNLKLKREQEESERRQAALRDVAADRMATSIGQLQRLLDFGLRQKYPPQLGGGMVR
jgi:hypothetical protein